MPTFYSYTPLTDPQYNDVLGVVYDTSAALASATKTITLSNLLKLGPWATTVKTVSATANVTLVDDDVFYVDITPTAARDVTMPPKALTNHMYLIRNLSGTYTLTVKKSTGTTITTVAAGECKLFLPSTLNDFTTLTVGSGSGLSDGDKGDITVSSSGSVWTIDSGVVTLAKMANMATASILGRNTAGTGAPEVLSASTVRSLLSLVVGTNVQAYHSRLDDIAGITYAQGDTFYYNGTNIVKLSPGISGQFLKTQGAGANPIWATIAGGGDLLAANNLSDLASAATARSNLGLVIGTNVQAYDAELAALAGLTSAADSFPYFTGSGTASLLTIVSAIRTLLASANVATFRSNAGLAIGTDVQAYHARLADIAGITYAQGDVLYYNGTNIVKLAAGTSGQFLKTLGAGANPAWATIPGGGDLLSTNNLSDVANAATARTNLGLAIGTNVQAYHARLADIAGITYAQGDVLYYNGTNIVKLAAGTSGQFLKTLGAGANPVWATVSGGGDLLSTNNLSDVANAATARTNLGLAIGTNVQAYDAELNAIAGLTSAADKAPYFTGSGTAALMDVSSAARTVLDDTTTAAMLTTLGAVPVAGGVTLTGAVNLGENAGLEFDEALSADGKYSGLVRAGTAGATLAFGDLCYLAAADSRWELVDANAESTSGGLLGMCVLAAAADGNATKMLMHGFIRADANFPTLTIGAKVFAATTAGDVQTTAPSGAADIIRVVGYADTADSFYFNPSADYYEHV